MLKNKNLNFALIVFALTMTFLFAYAEYYPDTSVADKEIIEKQNKGDDNLVITSN